MSSRFTTICFNCGRIFYTYVKNSREQATCPICPDDEGLGDE